MNTVNITSLIAFYRLTHLFHKGIYGSNCPFNIQIKLEIRKIIDKAPGDMLEEIYSVLRDFADKFLNQ